MSARYSMKKLPSFVMVCCLLVAVSACSPKHLAVNSIGDMLAEGDSVYESDDDIVLVGEALPFSLKLVESLLAESPKHRGLLLTASRGFVLYTYAYVHYEAELANLDDFDRALELRARARKLYLRSLNYAIRALDESVSGFEDQLADDPEAAVMQVKGPSAERDLPFLYWSAAALGLAISVSKHEPALLARLPEVEALLNRALAIDEAWNDGALHEFKITWAAAQRTGAREADLMAHYERALELSQGKRASLYVSLAEAVTISKQDRDGFESLMEKALAVDPDADPRNRLMNVLAQRRARWLLDREDELFF